MSKKADLSWNVDGLVHSFNYYRYEAPTAIENLPAPLVSDISSNNYTDTTVEDDKQYYWRIGAVRDGNEKISDESAFSTMDYLKHWILSNSTIGDAWFVDDAVVDSNNAILSIPSISGKLSSLNPVGSLVKSGKKTDISPGNYLKLSSGNLQDFKFLHIPDSAKYIIFAVKVLSSNNRYNPIFCTGNAASSQTGLTVSIDMRTTSSPRKNAIFHHATWNSQNYLKSHTTNGSTVPLDAIAMIEYCNSGNLSPDIKANNANVPWFEAVTGTTYIHRDANPSGLPTIGATVNGTTFSFSGEFYGLMFSDVMPTEEDRQRIYSEFQLKIS